MSKKLFSEIILKKVFKKGLKKELEEQRQEAIQSKEQMESILKQVQDSLISVKNYHESLNNATERTHEQSYEIIESIQSILKSFEFQTHESSEMVSAMTETNYQVEDMISTMNEMTEYLSTTKQATYESEKKIGDLESDLEDFNGDIQKTIGFMEELHLETENIESIIKTISDISAQTNLLALNASIEAARAGEHGKGFAVVAEEVRKLADASKVSSESISKLLNEFRERINRASATISESSTVIVKNRESMEEVKNLFHDVSNNIESFTGKTDDLQSFIEIVQAMMQEVEAKATENVGATNLNKESLESVLEMISNQHDSISSLSEGFKQLEDKLEELNH